MNALSNKLTNFWNNHSLILALRNSLSLFFLFFLLSDCQLLQNGNPLALQSINGHFVLMPKFIASWTRFILPPRIVAPPPPFPIPPVVVQPSPILYVFFEDLCMALFQVRVYLLVNLRYLVLHYHAQCFLQDQSPFLADYYVVVDLGGRKLEVAISTFRSILFDFLQQVL